MIENILPSYLRVGVSEERFWDGTPADLKPYVTAFNENQKQKDADMWQMGIYVQSAVSVAVSNALYGKKSHAEYLKQPLYKYREEKIKEENMSEEEKAQGRKQLLTWLMLQKTNYELNTVCEE